MNFILHHFSIQYVSLLLVHTLLIITFFRHITTVTANRAAPAYRHTSGLTSRHREWPSLAHSSARWSLCSHSHVLTPYCTTRTHFSTQFSIGEQPENYTLDWYSPVALLSVTTHHTYTTSHHNVIYILFVGPASHYAEQLGSTMVCYLHSKRGQCTLLSSLTWRSTSLVSVLLLN